MSINNPPRLAPNGKVNTVFNPSDFEEDVATIADLNTYANKYKSNIFLSFNSFTSLIFTGTINNISATIFGFLSTLTSNCQDQLNTLYNTKASLESPIFTGTPVLTTTPATTDNSKKLASTDYVKNQHYTPYDISNTFSDTQTFNNITYTGSLNNISTTIFNYISSLSSNCQDQLSALQTKTTNVSYSDGTTYIDNNTYFTNTAINNSLAIGSNLVVGSSLNVNNISNVNLFNNNINTQKVNTTELFINNIKMYETLCYLYVDNKTFPIIKSMFISELNVISISNATLTIKPNATINILDVNNIIIYSLTNLTTNCLYNQSLILNDIPYKINMYCNNIIIQ